MKFFVILFALTSLATASLFTDKLQDENLFTHSDIGKHMLISEPWNFWTKLGLHRTTPVIMAGVEPSGLDRMAWWMCKDSLCLHHMMQQRTPTTMGTMLYETPNMYGMDTTLGMTHMPSWMCKDLTCLLQMKMKRTPSMMDKVLYKTPNMHEMDSLLRMTHVPWLICNDNICSNQMISQTSPMMMQTKLDMPTQMGMNHMMVNDRMIPMMQLEEMTPTGINTINHLMRMNQNIPLEDTSMINGDMTKWNNFWNMYIQNRNILGKTMDTQRRMDGELII